MKAKIAKFLGIITVPPLVGLAIISWMWLWKSEMFGHSLNWYLTSIGLLAVVPALAYPLSYILPKIRSQGRDGQRKLAFIMCLVGYGVGVIAGQVGQAPGLVKCLFWGYLLSGLLLAFINQVLKYKASGHACGVAGPITFLAIYAGGDAWYLVLLLPLVFWSRIKQDRHTLGQMLAGTLSSALPTAIVLYLYMSNYH